MRTTVTVIKADIGSIGGHLKPSEELLKLVKSRVEAVKGKLIIDCYVSHTGDDIAILCTHDKGKNSSEIHKMAWDTLMEGANLAKKQGLYGAGQDLLKDAFSGNVKGLGPAVAELEFDERPNEPFLFFAADKTDPGAYNLPLYLGFCDPMHCSGLILSSKMAKGFRFEIMDVSYTEKDRIITLNSPEELYDIAALLRDPERFVVAAVYSRESGEQVTAASTTRLHNIAGKYVGKDDPIMLVRVQGNFPATGEVLSPYVLGHYVAGFMRGSHNGPLMPVKLNSTISYFDGPPVVSCAAFCVHEGHLTEAVDAFDHPLWDYVRQEVSKKGIEIRRQGFFGNAMLPMSELEYGGIADKLRGLEERFVTRG